MRRPSRSGPVGLLLTMLLLVAWATSCGRGAVLVAEEPRDVQAPELPWPAFAVYGAGHTLLVPLRGSPAGSVAGDGLWVMAGEGVARFATVAPSEALEMLPCEGEEPDEERCSLPELSDDLVVVAERGHGAGRGPTERFLVGAGADCRCFVADPGASGVEAEEEGSIAGESEASVAVDVDPAEPGSASAGETPCEGEAVSRYGPVSLVGGAVEVVTLVDRGACDGAPRLAWQVDRIPLVPSSSTLPDGGSAHAGCVPGVPFDSWDVLDQPCPASRSRREECGLCQSVEPSGWARAAWSGEVIHLGLVADAAGGTATWVRTEPVGPEACPSEDDPCGDPSLFVALAAWDSFWVASDDAAALVSSDGELFVLFPGAERPFWEGVPFEGDVIGVRYHSDATALREAIASAGGRRLEQLSPEAP